MDTKSFTIHGVDAQLVKALKIKAVQEDRDFREVVIEALEASLKKGAK